MDAQFSPPASSPACVLRVRGVDKSFTMHLQGGQLLPVLRGLAFAVAPGECAVLGGASGAGKSSVLKMVFGNYAVQGGSIELATPEGIIDIATASPRQILQARRTTMGYVSQFLRCVPRVPALQVVAEPLLERGVDADEAEERAAVLLRRLSIPERMWQLSPATFSGGEQQRINIARGFVADMPLLLLDEPTASLDDANRDVVVQLIDAKLAEGVAMLAIFHDTQVRERLASTVIPVHEFAARA